MKNIYLKSTILILFLLGQTCGFAFEHSITLNAGIFENVKFNFSFVNAIDGRLNKNKSLGYFCKDFSEVKESIGNDSLCEELNIFFKKNSSSFDNSNKIILVINQINIKEIKNSNRDDFEFSLSFDYYKTIGNKCILFYKQFIIYDGRVRMSKLKAINRVFSEAIKFALSDFNNKLPALPKVSDEVIDTSILYNLVTNKSSQVVNNKNIKDGLYFSGKDLYLNKPSSLTNCIIPDTAIIRKRNISLKSDNCPEGKAYAFVKFGRIFIYIIDDNYIEALIDNDGKLYLPNIRRPNITSTSTDPNMILGLYFGVLDGMAQRFPINALQEGEKINIYADLETGLWTLN